MLIFVLKGEKWFDKLFNVKYLPLFHHFKAIYQFSKHINFLVNIVANAPLTDKNFTLVQVHVNFLIAVAFLLLKKPKFKCRSILYTRCS